MRSRYSRLGFLVMSLGLVGLSLRVGRSGQPRSEPESAGSLQTVPLSRGHPAPTIRFGGIGSRTDERFEFLLVNDTDLPVQILGYDAGCSRQGCIIYEGLPLTLAAGQRLPVSYIINAQQPGHLDARTTLYTTVSGNPSFPLQVEGEILAAPATQ